jgi:glycosyltransferase involved in cell wall biosynthesis
MSIFMILAIIACASMVIFLVTIAAGAKKMSRLGDTETGNTAVGPLVSIIVPACNEEKNIEKSLLSLLNQDYKNLEIIVVNDRSTDGTAAVLQQMQVRFPELRIHEIAELPEGWMGKSHALSTGAALAKGDLLVFTDADVILEKTTIARAVGYMSSNRLDHLTLVFKNVTHGWLLNSLILDIGMGLLFLVRPWKARNSANSFFVGIGAFNMVKRSAYLEIGGHEGIRMHPVDDLMLGKMIKQHGFFQDCLLANDFVLVPWYDSVSAMITGLEKNMFALVHYRVWLVPVVLFVIFVPNILPVWGVIFGDNAVRIICFLTVGIRLAACFKGLRMQNLPWWYLPGFLITPYISCYIIMKSVFVTKINGGIYWRGQHYALAELRKTAPLLY